MESSLKKKRKAMLLEIINTYSSVSSADLAKILDVPEYMIRMCLNELAWDGLINKTRGGAMIKDDKDIVGNKEAKQIIAQKAVSLIKDGMLVLLGGGNSVTELIHLIPDDLHATFITGNPYICIELLKKPNLNLVLLGGKLSAHHPTATGGEVFEVLSNINADLCIMSASGIDPVQGITGSEWDLVNLKKAMFRAAKKVVILARSEKLNSALNLRISPIAEIDSLVTELSPDHEALRNYKQAGVSLL